MIDNAAGYLPNAFLIRHHFCFYMKEKKIRILVTNDDGINAEGIAALEKALLELGDVYVVAPATEMSGAAHSLTLARPLRIRQIDERHWTVDGTPTDCVLLALNQILTTRTNADNLRFRHQSRTKFGR